MSAEQFLPINSIVGRYRIEQVLGAGSHAVVYKAFDTILKRVVALKVLKPEVAVDQEIYARFEQEARAAANLMHPHIAWVLDIGQAEGKHFMAVKFVDGISLEKLITERVKLPWNEALSIVEQISLALDFAHSRGVIHRDVKPKNILVSQQEGAVLTDFGLAKVLYDSAVQTRVGMVLGSPGYIPPEIWSGEPVTHATDQYALACVFYEMLCGKPLFGESGGLNVIIREHLEGLPLSKPWPDDIPVAVRQPLRKALSRKPEDRYENLATFIRDLRVVEPKIDTGDLSETPSAKFEIAEGIVQAEEKITPSSGVPSQETTKVDHTVKAGWKSKLRSLIFPNTQKFVIRMVNPSGRVFHIEKDHILIGRDPQCDISLEGMAISRQHVALTRTKDGYLIKDLNSKNGTFVNGERLIGIKLLTPGDVIDLGTSARLIFLLE